MPLTAIFAHKNNIIDTYVSMYKVKTYCVVFVPKYPAGQTFSITLSLKFSLYAQEWVASGVFMVGGSSGTLMAGMKSAHPKVTKHWKRIQHWFCLNQLFQSNFEEN